jgi:hypothetical protein
MGLVGRLEGVDRLERASHFLLDMAQILWYTILSLGLYQNQKRESDYETEKTVA